MLDIMKKMLGFGITDIMNKMLGFGITDIMNKMLEFGDRYYEQNVRVSLIIV